MSISGFAQFSFSTTKRVTVRIAYRGALVKTLTGKSAERFLHRCAGANPEQQQLLMAKATGNFKRGNERGV